ncbi:ankyrin repeat domain-containing protein 26, partial [Biomphalaria glabrata]
MWSSSCGHQVSSCGHQVVVIKYHVVVIKLWSSSIKLWSSSCGHQIESFKTRLLTSNQEMEKAISARNEMERDHKRDKETWLNELERKERELKENKEENQNLSQLLHNTEARLNVIENELHVSNTSLTERSSQYQLMKHELDRQIAAQQTLDQNYRQEKELNIKLQTKIETLQER